MFYTFYDDTFNVVCICEIENRRCDLIHTVCCGTFPREKCLKSNGFWHRAMKRFELLQFEWEIFENFITEKTNIEYRY